LPQTFALSRYGQLLVCKAEVTGPQATRHLALLLDTGSNYTVIATESLEAAGCRTATQRDYIRITTAGGVVFAPRLRTQVLTFFDRRMTDAEVIAYDLPFTGPIDGLLGMDLLVALRARIDVAGAQIELP